MLTTLLSFSEIMLIFAVIMKMHKTMLKENKSKLLLLITISTIVRVIIGSIIELGNDEAYYHILSLYPQLSYFDHPPMVALMINLSTFGATFSSEFAIRFFPIIIGAINTYIIYLIARSSIWNSPNRCNNAERRGLFAAILYTGSIYCSVLSGLFVIPDAPLSLFWLLAILMLIKVLPRSTPFIHSKMLLAGLFIGLAMLSKYSGAYLWGAVGLYILLYNRQLLRKWSLYIAAIISIAVFSPVIIWNYLNDFISFTFHSERVTDVTTFEPLYLMREFLGSIFYNGVINFLVLCSAIFYFIKHKDRISSEAMSFIVIFSVPMIALFLGISMFQATLPHWSAPGYFLLIILSSIYLENIRLQMAIRWCSVILVFTFVTLLTASLYINKGLYIMPPTNNNINNLGCNDVTLDMYGWEQFNAQFSEFYKCEVEQDLMPAQGVDILSYVWYEAAHLDSYVGQPNGMNVKTIGSKYQTHFYEWLTEKRGGYDPANPTPAYFIITSRSFNELNKVFNTLNINPLTPTKRIPIERNGAVVEYFLIYRILQKL